MIKHSIRPYSLNEISHFIDSKKYPEEFLKYLQVAPDNIKIILSEMGLEHEYSVIKETISVDVLQTEEETLIQKNDNEGKQPNNAVISEPNTIKTASLKQEDSITQKSKPPVATTDNSDRQDDETLYENMRFGDSITVKRLVLHEMKNPACAKHAKEYQNINVNISLTQGKFVFRTKCCPLCKKLYIKKNYFQGVKELFDRKKIDYAWISEDE